MITTSLSGCLVTDDDTIPDDDDALQTLRIKLISHIWGPNGFPERSPELVLEDINETGFQNLSNLGQIDRLEITSEFGIPSVVYHFHPAEEPVDRLIVYHQGHMGGVELGSRTLSYFLERGYSVLGYAMPLKGPNYIDEITLPGGSNYSVGSNQHAELIPLEENSVSAMRVFVEPIIVGLNYAESHFDYQSIDMIGISGGGWTTTLAAAIDYRIEHSYPVAGSIPFHLRDAKENESDFEQNRARPVYDVANYLDWYTLSGFGEGRRQLQILNQVDPCCYYSEGREDAIISYQDDIRSVGVDFEVFIDTEHVGHEISISALRVIYDDIQR